MNLNYNYWTGHINNVLSSMIRSLGQYTRYHAHVKVGMTNDPERRSREHAANGWNNMAVLYMTSSSNFVVRMEQILIEYHWDYIENEIAGGGGRIGSPPYYIYVLYN